MQCLHHPVVKEAHHLHSCCSQQVQACGHCSEHVLTRDPLIRAMGLQLTKLSAAHLLRRAALTGMLCFLATPVPSTSRCTCRAAGYVEGLLSTGPSGCDIGGCPSRPVMLQRFSHTSHASPMCTPRNDAPHAQSRSRGRIGTCGPPANPPQVSTSNRASTPPYSLCH
jgi:hypothetical protein